MEKGKETPASCWRERVEADVPLVTEPDSPSQMGTCSTSARGYMYRLPSARPCAQNICSAARTSTCCSHGSRGLHMSDRTMCLPARAAWVIHRGGHGLCHIRTPSCKAWSTQIRVRTLQISKAPSYSPSPQHGGQTLHAESKP